MRRAGREGSSLVAMVLLAILLAAACDGEPPAASPAPASAATAEAEVPGPPGDGFVVFESNRTGAWRLWIRDLDGSPPRQLSPDEGSRQHCCPHVSPDGAAVAFLSLPSGQENYPESGASGPLHLIGPGGSDDRVLVPEARTYFEHRAAVWKSPAELIYIDGEGTTRLLDLATGKSRALTERAEARHGWLVNSRLTHATTGRPSFSVYDAARRRIEESRALGGCQPYFSQDGRWGYWVAGAGGPIRAIELASRRTSQVLAKSDPRLPHGQGYLYFPMLSHDSTLIAVAASADEHDHLTSNYDVFVAATDPDTLEVLGPAWRATSHPASDRFPDVYSRPTALGRHFGEAPLRIAFIAAGGGDWRWRFGDGTGASAGARVDHTFERPGSYRVEARRGDEVARGFVRVRPPAPPEVASVDVRQGRLVVVRFDEEVDLADVEASFESGIGIGRLEPGDDGRTLEVEVADELTVAETLRLSGVRDRAQRPNTMPAVLLEVAPPAWPVDPEGLVFVWESGDGMNLVEDPATGAGRACLLEASGRAWLDRHFAMELAGGVFSADDESVLGVLEGCSRTNELTLEATLTPRGQPKEMGRIVTFSSNLRSRNFTLGQEGNRLVFRLRTATTGQNADRPQLDLGRLEVGLTSHVLVSYTPGRFIAWLDGRQTVDTDGLQDGFFHWQARPLKFGNENQAERPWHGALEAVAIYHRAFGEEEALESHRRALDRLAERARSPVPEIRLRATLERRSRTPALSEIAPYREALAVFEYSVVEVSEGDYSEPVIRVAHRVLVDGEALPVSRRNLSQSYELVVTGFFDNPQLESLYLSNTLPERPGAPLYFSPAIEP